MYYRTLNKKYTSYAGLTCLTLLTHLNSDYGRLTSQDIDEIDKQMKSQISGDTEFEAFSNKLRTDGKPCPFKTPAKPSKL